MPLYDYKCHKHGVFSELAAMADHAKPARCPECGALCARVIVLPPELALLNDTVRDAIAANEKAQHAPDIMTASDFHAREQEKKERHEHKHGSQCGCGTKKKPLNLVYTADGDKMFPFSRPWMISH